MVGREFLLVRTGADGRLSPRWLSGAVEASGRRERTMLRTCILRPRWLTIAVILWSAAWVSLPVPSEGAPLPPARAFASGEAPETHVEVAALQDALVAQGLSPADAERLVARLTPAERAELAERAQELAVGGDGTI